MHPSSQKTSVNFPHTEPIKLNAPPGSQLKSVVLWEAGENTHTRNKVKEIPSILSNRTISTREGGPSTKDKATKCVLQTFKWKYFDEPPPTTKCDGHKQ